MGLEPATSGVTDIRVVGDLALEPAFCRELDAVCAVE